MQCMSQVHWCGSHMIEAFHRMGVLHNLMVIFHTSPIQLNSKMQKLATKESKCGIEWRNISLYVLWILHRTDHHQLDLCRELDHYILEWVILTCPWLPLSSNVTSSRYLRGLYSTLKRLQATAKMWFSVRLLHIYPLPRLLIFCWQDDHHPDWPATDCPYGGHASTLSLLFVLYKYVFNACGSDNYWLWPFQEGWEGQRPFVRTTCFTENIALFIFFCWSQVLDCAKQASIIS